MKLSFRWRKVLKVFRWKNDQLDAELGIEWTSLSNDLFWKTFFIIYNFIELQNYNKVTMLIAYQQRVTNQVNVFKWQLIILSDWKQLKMSKISLMNQIIPIKTLFVTQLSILINALHFQCAHLHYENQDFLHCWRHQMVSIEEQKWRDKLTQIKL